MLQEEEKFGTPEFKTPLKREVNEEEERSFVTPYVLSEEKKEFEVRLQIQPSSYQTSQSSSQAKLHNPGIVLMEYDGKIIHFDSQALVLLNIPFENEGPLNFFEMLSPISIQLMRRKYSQVLFQDS
jgi:hypothetical protein